jgi:Ca2+-binding RTX toxin-like protein
MAASIVPSDFTINIDNPFFTLTPGTAFVYTDAARNLVDTVTVSRTTKVLAGVVTLAVHGVQTANGTVTEDTVSYYAQDRDGTVWLFGERHTQFNADGSQTHEGSWFAGVRGAQPGIFMEASPAVGDTYFEENAPGAAQDQTTVDSLDAQTTVGYGSFDDVLQTTTTSVLHPGVTEQNFYATDVGNLLSINSATGSEQLATIVINGTAGNDVINGYAGRDQLGGFAGNDVLNGALGDNQLSGGSGSDIFVFDLAEVTGRQTDTITDYRAGDKDLIRVLNGTISHDALVGGVWVVVFKDASGDSVAIRVPGVTDTDHDGHVFDQLLFG